MQRYGVKELPSPSLRLPTFADMRHFSLKKSIEIGNKELSEADNNYLVGWSHCYNWLKSHLSTQETKNEKI